jgi:hypothetical protein
MDDQPRHRRQRLALRDALQLALHIEQAAVALLLENRKLRIGLLLRAEISVSSCSSARFCCSSMSTFFLAVDLRDDRVALDFELRAPHVVLRFQQRDRSWLCWIARSALAFLICSSTDCTLRARFFERALPFAIVVLDDQILFLGQRAHRRQIASPAPCRTGWARSASAFAPRAARRANRRG